MSQHLLPPGVHISRSWDWEQNWDLNPDSLLWEASVPADVLTLELNAQTIYRAFGIALECMNLNHCYFCTKGNLPFIPFSTAFYKYACKLIEGRAVSYSLLGCQGDPNPVQCTPWVHSVVQDGKLGGWKRGRKAGGSLKCCAGQCSTFSCVGNNSDLQQLPVYTV